ncbi:MAG: DHHW family protein [Clostridia bacterium]|nr:DHHW family protein [Clostridia bacterium]
MKRSVLNLATIISLGLILLTGFIWCVLKPADELSTAERRSLQQFPSPSLDTVLSGEWMEDFDAYTLDQFPLRDHFRTVKALWQFEVLRQKDNNGIYIVDGNVYKLEYPLNENSVVKAANKLNELYDLYLADSECTAYYAVVPDKNYFAAEQNGYPALDYERLLSLLSENIEHLERIDIFDCLSAEDYYRTDAHWRQEKLEKVVARLSERLGFEYETEFEQETLAPFYGVYYGQAALPIASESLTILHSDTIDSAVVTNYETGEIGGVYDTNDFFGLDPYDVFLQGACPLMTIENPNSDSEKELIIFRDSFGSSLAPLLIAGYEKITLVDIRYISSSYVGEFVDFSNQDVLFIYSTLIINNSESLK